MFKIYYTKRIERKQKIKCQEIIKFQKVYDFSLIPLFSRGTLFMWPRINQQVSE